MAVTITLDALRGALRLGDTPEENAEATRLLAYATTAIAKHAPTAPDAVSNEAATVLAGYLFDKPTSSSGGRFANALRNSGPASILLLYLSLIHI